MLIALARTAPASDTSSSTDDTQSGYLLPSVTGAMYLLVASTAHDLRAGFSLLVDGSCSGHRVFGIGLLVVYGIMVTAAMMVLVSTSADSASVVLNAVTVLCIADLVSAARVSTTQVVFDHRDVLFCRSKYTVQCSAQYVPLSSLYY